MTKKSKYNTKPATLYIPKHSPLNYMEFRSGLEEKIGLQLENECIKFSFETIKLKYTVPESTHTYTPDFNIQNRDGSAIIIETKGRLTLYDRKKMILVKKTYPDLDIRFLFTNSKSKIRKGSKTTYGMWAEKEGFPYADKTIPKEWLKEMQYT